MQNQITQNEPQSNLASNKTTNNGHTLPIDHITYSHATRAELIKTIVDLKQQLIEVSEASKRLADETAILAKEFVSYIERSGRTSKEVSELNIILDIVTHKQNTNKRDETTEHMRG